MSVVAALVAIVGMGAVSPRSALASEALGPQLEVRTLVPDYAKAGEQSAVFIYVLNTGDRRTSSPIVISDVADPQMTDLAFEEPSSSVQYPETSEEQPFPASSCEASGGGLTCTIDTALPPGAVLSARFSTTFAADAAGVLDNEVTVQAAGVPSQIRRQRIEIGEPGPFAFDSFTAALIDSMRQPLVQAASVPNELGLDVQFAKVNAIYPPFDFVLPAGVEHVKDVTLHLPTGLIGNPTAAPTCKAGELVQLIRGAKGGSYPACPPDSQVGVVQLLGSLDGLYNMVPPPGAATELGFNIAGTIITLDAYLRPADEGIDIVSRNTPTTIPLAGSTLTIWGDPASSVHDRWRGECIENGGGSGKVCGTHAAPKAFVRLPTSCGGALPFGAQSNSWEHPGRFVTASYTGSTLGGCGRVPFEPTIFTRPTATAADSPTGVAVQLGLPQNENPDGLAEGDLKEAVVRLPEGMALNPSSADGLKACDDAHLKLDSGEPSACPDASKVGTVTLQTPLLESPIEGFIWLRTQSSSDPASGDMFRLAIELRDDRHGIDIKLPGNVSADPRTGRLTSVFDDAPQLPFSFMTLHFKAGARAPLTTPYGCEPQTTEADLYSWSEPAKAVHTNMTFQLTSGPEGAPCMADRPFDPGFNAGVKSVQAGGFTPFLATFSRKDVDQSMQRVSVTMPKGLLGSLVGLPLCPEAQANAGTCSQASEIGTVTAGAGDGPTPYYVTGGHVYMTQSYEGAPFGLSVVVPAKTGPFDLGTVVVRGRVEVDPHTAQLTITTDALPQIVGGVPVNLRLVNVTIDRPNFAYNPTDCDPMQVTGAMTGGQGAVAALSNHFQVTNCGALKLGPKFKVSTSGRTSRRAGASLQATLLYPRGPQGTQANIAKVKVSLPKQLPSRLTTLQHACPAATFRVNPASCPATSRIGVARASTPVLPVALVGPVYFVSHGGAAFPDLVVVLQGYGVTVDLVGSTFISKAGVTSTTFKQVPDVPVGSFQLRLPQGPNSALAANGNLCAAKLTMPTVFLAQDGQEIKTNTPIAVSGCPTHRPGKRRKHGKR